MSLLGSTLALLDITETIERIEMTLVIQCYLAIELDTLTGTNNNIYNSVKEGHQNVFTKKLG